MRKTAGILSVFAFFFATLFHAVPAGAGEKPMELTYWGLFSGGDGDFMNELIAGFNAAHPGIQVKYMGLIYNEYYMKLRTAAAAGRGPDLAISHLTQLAALDREGILAPLDEAAQAAGVDWKAFNQNTLAQTMLNGKHMAVPLDMFAFVLFANRKLLAQASVLGADGKPVIVEGPEGFMDFLRKLKAAIPADNVVFATPMSATTAPRVFLTLFSQLDGKLLSGDGKKAALNEGGKAGKTLQLMVDMVNENLWPKGIQMPAEVFKAGKAALHAMGVWATGDFERVADLDFVVDAFPRVFDRKTTWGDSHTFILVKQRKQDPERAKAVAQFADWVTDYGIFWSKAGHIPSKIAVVESAEFKAQKHRPGYTHVADTAVFPPQSERIDGINEILSKHLVAALLGQETVDAAVSGMENEINKLLAKK